MKLKAVRGEIVPAAFAEYKISQGTRRHLSRKTKMMIMIEEPVLEMMMMQRQTDLDVNRDEDDVAICW